MTLAQDLVAGPHHVSAGAQLDLRRPVHARQQLRHVHGHAGKWRHLAVQRHRVLGAHLVERDGAGGDRRGVAVLHPQEHLLVRVGRGQAGVAVGRPGVGVVGDREAEVRSLARLAAVDVERVFHHVVAGHADRMDEQLAGELRQAEAGAHLAAVDGERAGAVGQHLLPGGQHGTIGAEQAQPQPHAARTVAGPVVGADQAGGHAVGVAEEGVVGGEVQPVQVGARGEHLGRQPCAVQRAHPQARRAKRRDALFGARCVEAGDQQVGGGTVRQVGQRARGDAGQRLAERTHVLHVELGGRRHVRMQGVERRGDAVRVEHGERAGAQLVSQGSDGFGGERVDERLVEDVAAAFGVEGLDV